MKTHEFSKKGLLSVLCVLSLIGGAGCSSLQNAWNGMNKTGQGASAGSIAGAAIGSGVGALIGGGRGTWIGALVGSAIGAGTGAVVGNSMDRQKAALEKELASVRELASQRDTTYIIQTVKDSNNLDAIKLVLGNSILFATNSYQLNAAAQAALSRIAYNLNQFPDTDVTIVGFTDNTGSAEYNQNLSLERARSVMNDLEALGVSASRLKAMGEGEEYPVASNATPEGRAQNRRVEFYITASQQMIESSSAKVQ